MCISCIRKLVQELKELGSVIVVTGGSAFQSLSVVQHDGHIHVRTVSEDATRGAWEYCGGSVDQLRDTADKAGLDIDIEEFPSMTEADERGLEEEVLEKLQECAQLTSAAAPDSICSVCRDVLFDATSGASEMWSLPCGHDFHVACIQPWFIKHHACPNCRTEVTVEAIDAAQKTLASMRKAECHQARSSLRKAFHLWAQAGIRRADEHRAVCTLSRAFRSWRSPERTCKASELGGCGDALKERAAAPQDSGRVDPPATAQQPDAPLSSAQSGASDTVRIAVADSSADGAH